MKTVLSYGAGTNSVAMLVALVDFGETPDIILFADTGGERPETYAHIEEVNRWLTDRNAPMITTVRLAKPSGFETLEDQCLRLKVLPPIAYGFRTCSQRYKIEPQDRYLREHLDKDEPYVCLVGYDFDEVNRWRNKPMQIGNKTLRFPLVEWQWSREDCLRVIKASGLSQPGKSACFFCPSNTKAEITALRIAHPDLYDRALQIERLAREGRGEGGSTGFRTVKGLGRHFSWETLEGPDAPPEAPCECFDD